MANYDLFKERRPLEQGSRIEPLPHEPEQPVLPLSSSSLAGTVGHIVDS
jgi:hypothetical protein